MNGIGVDVVSIERTHRVFSESFKRRVFTEREVAHAESRARSISHYAAMFAGKEAVFKALGTGWVDGVTVEIVRDETGRPSAKVHGIDEEALVSLAFEDEYAIAIAIVR